MSKRPALDWIRMRVGLLNHPKVLKIAKSLAKCQAFVNWVGATMPDLAVRHIVVSALHSIWASANEHAKGGLLEDVTTDELAEICGVPGIGQAMAAVGWAVPSEEGVILPKFERHNDPRKDRADALSGAERMAKHRSTKKSNGEVTKSDVTVTKHVTECDKDPSVSVSVSVSDSVSSSLKEGMQGEKTSESKTTGEWFGEFWAGYSSVRKTHKARARKAFFAAVRRCDPAVIVAAANEYRQSPTGKGQFALKPETWLNGECWDDDRNSWHRSDAGPPGKAVATQRHNAAAAARLRERFKIPKPSDRQPTLPQLEDSL